MLAPRPALGLAPMEGVSDFPLRLWMRLCSAPEFTGTPFLRVTDTFPQTLPLAWAPDLLAPELARDLALPTVPQLMGVDLDPLLRAGEKLLKTSSYVEINCGCPAPTVVGKGAGSGLLQDPSHFHKMIEGCVKGLGAGKVAVKMRTGFADSSAFSELIAGIADLPLTKLTVHGRSRQERYLGKASWELIETAAQKVQSPVFGSGDVTDYAQLQVRLTTSPSASGVIIGRGALRNPWIFEEVRTGESQKITLACLWEALQTYAYLLELFATEPQRLYALCSEGLFSRKIGTDLNAWQHVARQVRKALCGSGGLEENFTGKSLGRVKMLWSYLRSSLPDVYFQPQALRAKNLAEFRAALYAIEGRTEGTKAQGPLSAEQNELPLGWNAQHDWVYAGDKKNA